MRTSLFLAFLFLATSVSAQITIGEGDMPSVGDTLRFRTANGAGLALDLTGPDHIWDFGDLTPQDEVADTAVGVGSTPFLYQLFFNNIFFYPDYVADYAMKGASIGFQQLSLSEVYDYYRADADAFRNVGLGANLNGLPTSIRREPVDVIHQFPMDFGDEDSSTSAFNVTVPTVFYFGQDQLRHNIVDGWGTLYLPADTFQVLRVKSVLQRTDTIYIEQFGFGFRLPEPETIEYKWIAPGMGEPVLQVTTTAGIPISTRFFYEEDVITTGLAGTSLPEELTLYPNPANNEAFLSIPASVTGQLVLVDAMGREVLATNVNAGSLRRIDLSGLAAGNYSVQLRSTERVWNTSLLVNP